MKKHGFTALALVLVLVFSLSLVVTTVNAADIPEALEKIKPKDFPRKPIELLVVYPAGGGMDVTARVLAKHLPKYVGTKCIVINKTGGGGMVGHSFITRSAKNDGYTIGVLASSLVTDDLTRAKGKWSYRDVECLAYINFTPLTWVVRKDSEFGKYSLKEIIDYAKKNPNVLKISMIKGMAFQFLVEQVQMTTGAKFNMVGFQGGAPCITALLGGHVDVGTGFLGEYKGHLGPNGNIRPIAQAGPGPYPYLPGVPSFNEVLGVKDIIFGADRFCAVPKGISKDRAVFLETAIRMALKNPELIKDYDKIGINVDQRYMNAEETQKYIDDYYAMQKKLFKAIGRIK